MSDDYELPANFYPPEGGSAEVVTDRAKDHATDRATEHATDQPIDQATEQVGHLKDQAVNSASDVAGAAKDAAGDVVGEATSQARDLFRQTQSELKDQAATQQRRVALGLHSIADELGDMASSSQSGGVASDLVGQVASRAGGAATWLENRDPGSLLHEVRAYAARKPGTFIAIAAIAGLAAGRLTKNLASNAAEQKADQKNDQTADPLETNEVVYLDDEFGGAPVDGPIYGDRA